MISDQIGRFIGIYEYRSFTDDAIIRSNVMKIPNHAERKCFKILDTFIE